MEYIVVRLDDLEAVMANSQLFGTKADWEARDRIMASIKLAKEKKVTLWGPGWL